MYSVYALQYRDYGDQSSSTEVQHSYVLGGDSESTIRGAVVSEVVLDVWLDAGSIYIAFDKAEKFIECSAKVVIGVRNGRLADVEILLGSSDAKRLRELLKPSGNR